MVKAFAPATIANLGVGFDVLGMAVATIGDIITAEKRDQPGIEIVEIKGDDGKLPRDATQNTAAIAAQGVLDRIEEKKHGVRLWIEKGMPLASGLGSSAASAVAAAVATNTLFDNQLTREDLLPAVLDAEDAVSGRHADNVAPALLGGIVLVTGLTPAEIHRLPVPTNLYLSLVTPQIEISTQSARAVLPDSVPLSQLVHQTGVIAELIHALHMGNIHLLASSMQRDAVIEPARAHLIPELAEVREVATRFGALATIISGSGPTLCSFCVTAHDAEAVNRAVVAHYEDLHIRSNNFVATPANEGAHILD